MATVNAQARVEEEMTVVPRVAIRLPLQMPIPQGFVPERPETWPLVEGRLEYVDGRLLYMPPCGDWQQDTASDVTTELTIWRRKHPRFVVGSNEAGMMLGGEVRGADAAVFRKANLRPERGKVRRVPPVLAVEIEGRDEDADALRDKARWYLDHGVEVVWLLFPSTRTAQVVTKSGTVEVPAAGKMPPHPSLPGLEPKLADLFRQLSEE